MLRFSVVIPCYRDEDNLHCLLEQLQTIPEKPGEIIVVDGADNEFCRSICKAYRVHWLASQPCRGQQLLTGAARAQGDVLWFLHTDVRLTPNALAAMKHVIKNGAIGGYFKFRFDAPRDWPAYILERAIMLRCYLGVPYGDQGLFILKKSYHAINGHAPWPLFEEVPLVQGARKVGKFIALNEPIFVSSRRWRQDGWWRRTWNNRELALKFTCGVAPQILAQRYHTMKSSASQLHVKRL